LDNFNILSAVCNQHENDGSISKSGNDYKMTVIPANDSIFTITSVDVHLLFAWGFCFDFSKYREVALRRGREITIIFENPADQRAKKRPKTSQSREDQHELKATSCSSNMFFPTFSPMQTVKNIRCCQQAYRAIGHKPMEPAMNPVNISSEKKVYAEDLK
jgi:hypothetical protein